MSLAARQAPAAGFDFGGALARGGPALALCAFAAALAWTSLVRLPLHGVDFADDAFYDAIAGLWTRGLLPYVNAFDVKPPGFFALLAAAQLALGPGPGTVRALAIGFDALTAATLFFAGRRLGSSGAGALAAALYPVFAEFLPEEVAYSPLAAFSALACLAAMSPMAPLKRAALAGLAIGAAMAIKQTALLEAAAMLAGLLRFGDMAGRRGAAAMAFGIGAAAAPLAFLAYFAAHGAAGAMVADVVGVALRRNGSEGIGFFLGLALLPWRLAPLAPLLALALLPRRSANASMPEGQSERIWLAKAWFAATLLSLVLQRALFNCYLGPMLAPSLLLAGAWIAQAPAPLGRLPLAVRIAALGAVAIACLPLRMSEHFVKRHDEAALAQALGVIQASDPAPGDRLFVVDAGRWLYGASGLAPPTPYILPMHFLCDFPGGGPSRLREAMAAAPRYVVVGAYLGKFSACKGVEAAPIVEPELAHAYRLIGKAQGEFESYEIYQATRSPAAGG